MTPNIERLVSTLGPPFRSAFDVLSAVKAQYGPAHVLDHARPAISRVTRRRLSRKPSAPHVDDIEDLATCAAAVLVLQDWTFGIKRLTDWVRALEADDDCQLRRADSRLKEAHAQARRDHA